MPGRARGMGLVLGPGLAAALLALGPPAGFAGAAWATAALAAWMATWWVTEAVPLPVTALLPLPALPALGVSGIGAAAEPFASPLVFLFLGGFLLAAALQRHGLHRRLALAIVALAGPRPDRLVAGVLAATALISMWVSNTATAAMMLPIALALSRLGAGAGEPGWHRRFEVALLLALAFGANIGGVATLVGTPPNAVLAGFLAEHHGITVGFGEWMLVGVPVAAVMLALAWWLLARRVFRVGRAPLDDVAEFVARERAALGALTSPERRTAAVVGAAAAAWLGRPWLDPLLPGAPLTDAGIAITAAVALFALPARGRSGRPLIDWADTQGLAWGVLVLVGGGLSLGAAIQDSGLAAALGGHLGGVAAWPTWATLAAVAALTAGLSHVTSNTATTATLVPLAAGLGEAAGEPAVGFAAAVALAASSAFLLPVATPPNAIVFASERLRVADMVRGGAGLVAGGWLVATVAAWLLVPLVLG